MAFLNVSRPSALAITCSFAPISSQPSWLRTPRRARSIAVFNPVCPPSVGNSASGRSRSMIFWTYCHVIGSM